MNFTSSKSVFKYFIVYFYTRFALYFAIILVKFLGIKRSPKKLLLNSFNGNSQDIYLIRAVESFADYEITFVGGDVQFYSLKYFVELLTSSVWLTNTSMLYTSSHKPDGVKYINFWHGVPAVKAGNSVSLRKYYRFDFVDLMPISCLYQEELYQKIFSVKKEALMQVKHFRLLEGDKKGKHERYLFYAPSWRKYSVEDIYISEDILVKWAQKLELNLLISVHYKASEIYSQKYIISRDIDRMEILKNTHLFITDYSSLLYDAVILNVPTSVNIVDIVKVEQERGFVLNMQEFNRVQESEIFNIEKARKTCSKLRSEFGIFDMENSMTVYDILA